MGLSRQLKNETKNCPPTLVLVARRDDRWLATWSLADAVVAHPLDPGELTDAVVRLLRERSSAVALTRATAPAAHARAGRHRR
jgi:DNA-binding response OmpR family regulator